MKEKWVEYVMKEMFKMPDKFYAHICQNAQICTVVSANMNICNEVRLTLWINISDVTLTKIIYLYNMCVHRMRGQNKLKILSSSYLPISKKKKKSVYKEFFTVLPKIINVTLMYYNLTYLLWLDTKY